LFQQISSILSHFTRKDAFIIIPCQRDGFSPDGHNAKGVHPVSDFSPAYGAIGGGVV
jgi:hypothetical protein